MDVVSVINMKGGVAKTTLAVNLADCLVERHQKKVLLVDVDPQFNATQCFMKPEEYIQHLQDGKDTILNIFDRPNRAIASSVRDPKRMSVKSLEDVLPVEIKKGFHLLPGNLELFRLEMAPGDGRENRLKAYFSKLEEGKNFDYDIIIIDTPPTPSVWMTSALIASNYYLIPVKADPISLTGIDLLKNIVEEKKENYALSIECAGVVLTLTESNTLVYNNARKALQSDKYWNQYLYNASLPKRTKIASEQLENRHILQSGVADSQLALTKIAKEFLERIGE